MTCPPLHPRYRSMIAMAVLACGLVPPGTAMADGLSPTLASMAPLIGNWTCSGTSHAAPQSPEHDFEASFAFAPHHGGQWVRVEYTEATSPHHPVARNNTEFWGPLPDGTYRTVFFNAFGQTGQLASGGWQNDALTWAGEIATPGGPAPFRGEITLEDDARFTLVPSVGTPNGGWFAIATLACQRA